MVKVLVCYNLKEDQNQADYEKYLASEHNPKTKLVTGVIDSKSWKVSGIMQGSFPFQYVAEVLMDNEMAVMAATGSPQMQEVMGKWMPMVTNFSVIITKEVV